MKTQSFVLSAGLLATLLTLPAEASLVVTYAESPNLVTSSLANTQVYNFDSLSSGTHANVSWMSNDPTPVLVGSYNNLLIKSVDSYGGAVDAAYPGGSPYSVQGLNQLSSTTLTLSAPSAYFGLWWSAGDAANKMDFYSSGTLVAEFTTANLMDHLSKSYYGNPRSRALDKNEPFGFINFFADPGTVWDEIVFSNTSGGSGFESDNDTTRVAPWTPAEGPMPGVPLERVSGHTVTLLTAIPEPSGLAITGSVLALGLSLRRRFSI